jgi:hypothetical protein
LKLVLKLNLSSIKDSAKLRIDEIARDASTQRAALSAIYDAKFKHAKEVISGERAPMESFISEAKNRNIDVSQLCILIIDKHLELNNAMLDMDFKRLNTKRMISAATSQQEIERLVQQFGGLVCA